MCTLLDEAGFEIREIEDRTDFALDFIRESMATATNGPPALGIHLVMGQSAAEKLRNVVNNIQSGRIVPVQIIATRF